MDHSPVESIPVWLGKTEEGKDEVMDLGRTPGVMVYAPEDSDFMEYLVHCAWGVDATNMALLIGARFSRFDGNPQSLWTSDLDLYDAFTAIDYVNEREIPSRRDAILSTRSRDCVEYQKKTGNVMARLFVVVDEFLWLWEADRSRFERQIRHLALDGRMCGIHIVLRTSRITVESFSHALRAVIPSCIILDVPTRMGDEALLYSERWWGEPVKLRMEHGLRQLLQPTA